MRDKVISKSILQCGNLQELQGALTKLNAEARMISSGTYGGSSTVCIEDEDEWPLKGIVLVEKRLSDGSKVYNVRLVFDQTGAL